MLIYLDGSANKKAHPNENYAREIMELFTTGLGAYSERDVQEGARAFTGWHIKDDAFAFNAAEHDAGDKSFLGHTGPLDGTDIIQILAEHPATAERLTRRLFAFFVYDDPEPTVLAPFVAKWKATQRATCARCCAPCSCRRRSRRTRRTARASRARRST